MTQSRQEAKCPDDETLAQWAAGTLSAAKGRGLAKHLDGCEACQGVVAALLRIDGAVAAPAAFTRELPAQPSEVLQGKYVLGNVLYQGERSVVFDAVDRSSGYACAVKFPVLAEGFAALGRKLKDVRSTGIAQVFRVVSEATTPFWVMERVAGQKLSDLPGVPAAVWAVVARDMVAVLSRLSAAGVRHGAIDARRVVLDSRRSVLLGFSVPAAAPEPDDALALARMLSSLPVTGRPTLMMKRVRAIDGEGALAALKRAVT